MSYAIPDFESKICPPALLTARAALLARPLVFTNGCFDILHRGHITYLNQAKALGDVLVVAVNTDESVQRLKGPTRPINSLEDRLQVLGNEIERAGGTATALAGAGVWLSTRSRRPEESAGIAVAKDHAVPRDAALPELRRNT